jgi:hypothetical protein
MAEKTVRIKKVGNGWIATQETFKQGKADQPGEYKTTEEVFTDHAKMIEFVEKNSK